MSSADTLSYQLSRDHFTPVYQHLVSEHTPEWFADGVSHPVLDLGTGRGGHIQWFDSALYDQATLLEPNPDFATHCRHHWPKSTVIQTSLETFLAQPDRLQNFRYIIAANMIDCVTTDEIAGLFSAISKVHTPIQLLIIQDQAPNFMLLSDLWNHHPDQIPLPAYHADSQRVGLRFVDPNHAQFAAITHTFPDGYTHVLDTPHAALTTMISEWIRGDYPKAWIELAYYADQFSEKIPGILSPISWLSDYHHQRIQSQAQKEGLNCHYQRLSHDCWIDRPDSLKTIPRNSFEFHFGTLSTDQISTPSNQSNNAIRLSASLDCWVIGS